MKLFFTILLLLNVSLSYSQELTTDENTLLLLHFNNSVNGVAGETPFSSANISYAPGKLGNALSISSNTTLRFDTAQNLNPKQGTLEFWINPTSEGVLLDMGVGGGLSAQVGTYTRMIFNIFGINGNPEVGVFGTGSIWSTNTWHHIAFTWGNRELKFYHNGSFFSSSTINFDIPNINLTYFNIGSTIGGSYQAQGLLDELRISNKVRTQQEICQSYLSGQSPSGINNIAVRNNTGITLYKSWNIYLEKAGFWKVPSLYSLNGTDTINISNTCASWSVSDPSILEISNGVVTGKKAGSTSIIATVGNQSVSIQVNVIDPVKPVEYEISIDPFLAIPASCHTITVPVVAIIFIPTLDGVNINTNETDFLPIPQQTITEGKKWILGINLFTKFALEEGSKFRGYSNPNANPYLGYKIIDYIYVYEPIPRGIPTNRDNPGGIFFSDYDQIIKRFNGQNYVDNLGVKEFWVLGYHKGEIVPVESNMSSPTTNDISNSFQWVDDMPVYSKTYVTYNYNYTRGGNEATHNHGHQIESMCDYVARKQDGNSDLFSRDFRGYTVGGQGPLNRCGDTHHPPNSRNDYDYNNSTLVASDIMDWKPAGGTQTMVNNTTWGNINYKWPSSLYPSMSPGVESNWYVFWMQSIPGNGNQIPYGNKWMTNWWRFLADWDSTNAKIGLYQNNPESNIVCSSSISTTLISSTVCAGSLFSVNYVVNGISLTTGNIFTVQLSDATGSFSNFVNAATLNSVSNSGTINFTIPQGTTAGSNYLLRTVSSNQAYTGSASAPLTIKSLPSTPAISAGATTTFCLGGGVTLTSNAVSGNQWYKDGIAINGSTSTLFTANASGSYTTKVTSSGCESSSSNPIAVTVNPVPPTPVIAAGTTTTLCTGGSVTLTSNAASSNQWYKDGVAISGSTGTALNVNSSGMYTTKVTVNSCESPASNTIAVTVNAIPSKPIISRNGADMVSSAVSGNQWFIDGASISGATSSTYRPSASGQVSVQATVNNCMSQMSDTYYFLITGIIDPTALDNFIHIFPNPVSNKLSIVSSYQHPLQIRIFDIAGHSFLKLTKASGNIEIDMGRYTAGSYLLEIKDSKSSKSYRKIIIKQY